MSHEKVKPNSWLLQNRTFLRRPQTGLSILEKNDLICWDTSLTKESMIKLEILYKEDFEEFQIPENIYLTSLNYDTGNKSRPGEKTSITEALKLRDINNIGNNNLISINGRDNLVKFRQFY